MKTRVRRRKLRIIGITLVLLLVAYAAWCVLRPIPAVKPTSAQTSIKSRTEPSQLAWPGSQAAVTIVGTNILETNSVAKPVPTASTAKIITALLALQQKPLKLGQQGPAITLNDNDVNIYKAYVAKDGSVVPVQAGEQISQYKMLQTVMLPSANNMADSLAIWSYGSLKDYANAANSYLAAHGLKDTHVGADASGLSSDTTSTAADLAKLGALAMQNPVLAQIVGQSTASDIPLAGTIKNVNVLLGNNGIIGVKTGNSDQAGGAYVAASQTTVNGKVVTIVTAVVDAPTLFVAMKDSIPLMKSAQANFQTLTIVNKNQAVGSYKVPWVGTIVARSSSDLKVSVWRGSAVNSTVDLKTIGANTPAGQIVGAVNLSKSALNNQKLVTVRLDGNIEKPTIWWRLSHPLQ